MVKSNLLVLTASFYFQLIMKAWSLPLHHRIELMRSNDGTVLGNEMRRHRRSPAPSFSIFLYIRNTNKFLKVTAKKITALAPNRKDKYAELIMTKLGFEGQISLKGKESEKFICMNSSGRVVLKKTFTMPECMFYNVLHKTGYNTFRSAYNEKWHLGFKRRGTIKHGHKTKHHHRAAWMITYPN